MPTIPVSKLRTQQASILEQLHDTPILLTQKGHGAGVLVHPDQWNELVELLADYEDAQIAHTRHLEAEQDPTLLKPLRQFTFAPENG